MISYRNFTTKSGKKESLAINKSVMSDVEQENSHHIYNGGCPAIMIIFLILI